MTFIREFPTKFGQILIDAGADTRHKNRYGLGLGNRADRAENDTPIRALFG